MYHTGVLSLLGFKLIPLVVKLTTNKAITGNKNKKVKVGDGEMTCDVGFPSVYYEYVFGY